ncbi:hypothetical protein AYI70_g902 [Smittium culicis]|uniref:HMG box domain-containing protein n=1 Tax=Smittium culicis TaxID=133412 RepID=A0A1R1X4D7_9FUNG|nr:hypothetical protein AYI70_g10908 [Smittium culicis]OMJ11669.1 hypothetical protein AYI70_g9569 [Smittium culicis]OMJ25424.1 hypothetical protein AYI70_g902 [Smittium culicis]
MLLLKIRGSSTLSKITSTCLKTYAASLSPKLALPTNRASFFNLLSRHFSQAAIISNPDALGSSSSSLNPKSTAEKTSESPSKTRRSDKKSSASSIAAKKRTAERLEKKRKELIAARVLKRSIVLKKAKDRKQALKDKLFAKLNSTKKIVKAPSIRSVSPFNAYVGEQISEYTKIPDNNLMTSRASILSNICNQWASIDPQARKKYEDIAAQKTLEKIEVAKAWWKKVDPKLITLENQRRNILNKKNKDNASYRKLRKIANPFAPKLPPGTFGFFVKHCNSVSSEKISIKQIAEVWKNMPDSEKHIFYETRNKARQEYESQKLLFSQSL